MGLHNYIGVDTENNINNVPEDGSQLELEDEIDALLFGDSDSNSVQLPSPLRGMQQRLTPQEVEMTQLTHIESGDGMENILDPSSGLIVGKRHRTRSLSSG